MPEDIKKIRIEKKTGVSDTYLAVKYKVSSCLIHYWTNEKYRQKTIDKAKMIKKDKEKKKEIDRKSKKHILKDNPLMRKYMREKYDEYRKRRNI